MLAALAELAVAMGETERAQNARAQLEQIDLKDAESEQYRDELLASVRLEEWIGQSL